ncbi:MAG: DUF4123 domain-containing protein [Candidatus Methylumidiphilus alinenensis]|uniref:DUF4123 domain-containing protein n=1 Tax=Candidatus Methylumidiphilus alinenensis TaxID=2202197 RepID=A0A2W4QI02_9GAMM|nr:MAG: DUF4123 domain-containing protein [Candidatus Methylumidiphilus alinenensis]
MSTPLNPQQTEAQQKDLARLLFADPGSNAYAVLDGASNPALLGRLHADQPEFVCLYRGELAPDVAKCAPYLVRLEQGKPFALWVIANCLGKHWGIFALSRADLRGLRQHFRKFNMVYDPEGNRPLLFRYYDPRVLRIFLPSCNKKQQAEFYGPVDAFFAEAEDGKGHLRFDRIV